MIYLKSLCKSMLTAILYEVELTHSYMPGW